MNNNKEMTQEVIEESIREIYEKVLNEGISQLQSVINSMEHDLKILKKMPQSDMFKISAKELINDFVFP